MSRAIMPPYGRVAQISASPDAKLAPDGSGDCHVAGRVASET
jgi:hypothetical protein